MSEWLMMDLPEITEDYAYKGSGNPNRDEERHVRMIESGGRKSVDVMRQLLADAAGIVTGNRHEAYGKPEDNHRRTAEMWSTFLGVKITPRQVCYMNVLQKCSREVNWSQRENDLDIAGYAANAAACREAAIYDPDNPIANGA